MLKFKGQKEKTQANSAKINATEIKIGEVETSLIFFIGKN